MSLRTLISNNCFDALRPIGPLKKIWVACAAIFFCISCCMADEWPTRPVTVVVPNVPGGFTDSMARIAADHLSKKYGQPFIVENRGGAGGIIGATAVAKAKPDGYTVLFGAMIQLTLAPLLQPVAYDPEKDLVPITEFGTGTNILGVKSELPVNTLPEFIEYARAHPGKLSYAGVNQTVTAIVAGMLVKKANLDMTFVSYKGGPQAVTDLLGGHIDMYFGNASEMLPFKEGGKIKLLAVSGKKRIEQAPNLPTIAEFYPGFAFGAWVGFIVPAGTPKEVVDKIVAGNIEAVNSPKVKEQFFEGAILPGGTTPEQSLARFVSDKALFAEAVDTLNLRHQ
jgi:tripartite-type tricarboxylate transporter receptor subunit TctC